jgi:hypothetical protein
MKKILFLLIVLILPLKNIAQGNINFKTVEKKNKVSEKDSLELLKNCIISYSNFPKVCQENQNLLDTLNTYNLMFNLILVDLKDIPELKIHSNEITNNIIIKSSYQINKSLFKQYLPLGFKETESQDIDESFIYAIHRDENQHTCTLEEKKKLFRNTLFCCVKIISKSENSVENIVFQNKQLEKKLYSIGADFNNMKSDVSRLEDSINSLLNPDPIKNQSKFELNTDFQTLVWNKTKDINQISFKFNQINQFNFTVSYIINSEAILGIGFGNSFNLFKTSLKYDSISIPIKITDQNEIDKAIISRSISESNSFHASIFSFLVGYKIHLTKSKKLDLIIDSRFCVSPKVKIASQVKSSDIDYVGYFEGINEPIINIDQLGLRNGVQFNNLEKIIDFQQIGVIVTPKFVFNGSKFNASIGLNYSFQSMKNIGTIQKYISSNYNEFNSSISRLNKFSYNSLLLNFSIGIFI